MRQNRNQRAYARGSRPITSLLRPAKRQENRSRTKYFSSLLVMVWVCFDPSRISKKQALGGPADRWKLGAIVARVIECDVRGG